MAPTPASPALPLPEPIDFAGLLGAHMGEAFARITQAEQRVTYLERQLRMLLTDLGTRRIADVCMDSRCLAGHWGDVGQVPHAAEQPNRCPILEPPP